MPLTGLLVHLGIGTHTGVLGSLQPALGGALATEAASILAAGDEDAAVAFVDRIVRGQTPDELLGLLRQACPEARTFFSAERKPVDMVLRGDRLFAELVIDLKQHFENRDFEALVIVMEETAVLSRGVARFLRSELAVSSKIKQKKTSVFVARLAQVFLDPALGEFPTITHHPSSENISALQTLAEQRSWVMTEMFGRITLFTAAEFQNLLLGEKKGLFHPNIKIFFSDEAGSLKNAARHSLTVPLPTRSLFYSLSSLVPQLPGVEGALMLVNSQLPRKTENSNIPYVLLRRVIYRHLAYGTEAHFREAAALVENIADPSLLARFFDDLRMGKGAEANGFKNAERFFSQTAVHAGRMFAAMSPATVSTIFFILHQHTRWHDQKGLDHWLLLAFKSIRSSREGTESEPAYAHLSNLSVILGTLIEWKETREMVRRMLEEGLNLSHEAYGEIYNAMDQLHDHSPEFPEPMAFSAGSAPVFDEERALRELGVIPPSGVLDRVLSLAKGKTPWAPVFSPPPKTLANREIVFERLHEEWVRAIGKGSAARMGERVLFSLPPAEVYRLAKEVGEAKGMSPFNQMAAMLMEQPTEVSVAFFKAWGHGSLEDGELAPLGQTLMALWQIGDVGERQVTDIVDKALEDEGATEVLQKILSQSGDDGEWMIAQIEIYLKLAERLGAKINAYEVFATAGVLKPADLQGRFRDAAIWKGMENLRDLDKFGKINVPNRLEFRTTFSGDQIRTGAFSVKDPEKATSLTKEEQSLWRWRIVDLLVELKADIPEVVNYLATMLSTNYLWGKLEGEQEKTFHALDRLGVQGRRKLVEHISAVTVTKSSDLRAVPFSRWRDQYHTYRPGMAELIKMFSLTSRGMQAWLRKEILKESGHYQKEFKKHGHMDRIVGGEVQVPAVIRDLAALGDEALALMEPFIHGEIAFGTNQIVTFPPRYTLGSSTTYWKLNPIFLPLLHLAEMIGTPAAHQTLVDLYKRMQTREETEALQAPMQIIIHALTRLEKKLPGT